ncbi:hypothetical protein M527_11965 [Sphingobium indicum IP26]|nr:hypothetical protein M527_11965 [Sphingobium indicum IP26]EQA97789.1 hypothetical protein L286_21690 [Sphingobium sp. HDIP04]
MAVGSVVFSALGAEGEQAARRVARMRGRGFMIMAYRSFTIKNSA